MEQEKQRAYLKRLGLTQTGAAGEEQLNTLIRAHMEQIPFENLDVYDFHKVPTLDPDSLFEKIITGRRGGYCFELNRLLLELLESLGYEAHPVAVRVMWNRMVLPQPRPNAQRFLHGRGDLPPSSGEGADRPVDDCLAPTEAERRAFPPATHMGIVAQCDGKSYYCDVGYGGPGPKGLLKLTPEPQTIYDEQFRVMRADPAEYRIEKVYHGEWKPVLQFEDHPCRLVDFEPLNFYCAKNPAVLFTQKRVLYLYTPNGWKSLTDRELTISENGEITKLVYHEKEQLEQGLLEEFGIQISLP